MLMANNAMAAKEPQITSLQNGLTVLIQEDERFPLVSMRLYVRAGSAYERPEEAGISHFFEHMVFKGTERRGPGELAQAIESVGGNINAATSFDYTVYLTDAPSDHWALGLDVLQDMVFGSVFDPEELESEKNVVLAELERGEDNPGQRLFKSQQAQVWADTPYARPIIGYRDTVMSITRDDLNAYIDRLYQPRSMLLVVVGNVETQAVLEEAEKLFGNLKNDRVLTPAKAYEPAQVGAGPLVSVQQGAWNKVYLSVAFPTPGFQSAQAVGLYVLGHLLGGDKTSQLYRKFKYEERLVHDISMSLVDLERTGMLYLNASLDADKLQAFWKALNEEFAGLKAGAFTDEELDRTKLNLEDSLYQAKETLAGLASKLGYFQFFEHSLQAEDNYVYELQRVGRDDLQQLIDIYLRPDQLYATVLAPQSFQLAGEKLKQAVAAVWPNGEKAKQAMDARQGLLDMTVEDLGAGRTLVMLPDTTLPYTSVDLVFRGGDGLLAPDEQGLAELTARVLPKGAAGRSATQIQDFLADHAANLNANAIRDLFTVSAKFPKRFSSEVLGLFHDVLTEPAFSDKETANEAENLVASIRSREDQPLGLAFRNIFPFLFRDHHYAYFHQGMPEQLPLYASAAVQEYWERQRRTPWTLAVCGDFDVEEVRALAAELREELPGDRTMAFTKPEWSGRETLSLHLPERNQEHLILVFPTPGINHSDTPGLNLMRSVLAGQSGLLFRELRDKQGLGYTVTAFLWQGPSAGFMAFYIGTYPEKAEQALEGFRQTAKELGASLLPESEIARGKNVLTGEYYREHQSLASRSHEAASLRTQGMPLDWNEAMLDKVKVLTPEDMQRLAQTYLNMEKARLLRVKP